MFIVRTLREMGKGVRLRTLYQHYISFVVKPILVDQILFDKFWGEILCGTLKSPLKNWINCWKDIFNSFLLSGSFEVIDSQKCLLTFEMTTGIKTRHMWFLEKVTFSFSI